MTFKVIDAKTGKEPTDRVIYNIAKKGGLMIMDIDQFFIGEDGALVLVDDCGNATWCDPKRFKAVMEEQTGSESMSREDELEILKIDLENIIDGMTICKGILSPEEHSHLELHKRCLSILKRIKPADEEETK